MSLVGLIKIIFIFLLISIVFRLVSRLFVIGRAQRKYDEYRQEQSKTRHNWSTGNLEKDISDEARVIDEDRK